MGRDTPVPFPIRCAQYLGVYKSFNVSSNLLKVEIKKLEFIQNVTQALLLQIKTNMQK